MDLTELPDAPATEKLREYAAAFGEQFPSMLWRGPDDELIVLIDEALTSGVAWDEHSLAVRQGETPPPEGAVV